MGRTGHVARRAASTRPVHPDDKPVRVLGRRLPPTLTVRVIVIAPGATRPYDAADWRSALAVVEQGEVHVEWIDGRRWRHREGDVLFLAGLPVRAVHNPATQPAVIATVRRRGEPRPSEP